MPSAMPQPKPQQGNRPQQGRQTKQVKHSDFSEAYAGRLVTITLANGAVLKGIVVEARRFWIQVMVDGKPHFINKAYIVEIVPG